MQQRAESSSVPVPLIPSPHPLQFLYSPIGNPSKYAGPLRLEGEHAPRECMCIVSPDAQEDIDMVIVSTPVKRWCPLGTAIQPPLPFLCGSCRVIGWLLRTWWTQPNIQGDVARLACVPAPPGTPDTYFSVCQGRGLIRRGEETREKAAQMGGVEGASDEWREWVAPGGLKQLKQTGPQLMPCVCLPKSSLW